MVTDPPYGVNYDPAWRNQAGRSINGMTQRIATGAVIKPIGARAVGKVVNDDRADWRIRDLIADPMTVITRGSTYDNRANLALAFSLNYFTV